jgi:hypothetical protein
LDLVLATAPICFAFAVMFPRLFPGKPFCEFRIKQFDKLSGSPANGLMQRGLGVCGVLLDFHFVFPRGKRE